VFNKDALIFPANERQYTPIYKIQTILRYCDLQCGSIDVDWVKLANEGAD
jgi:hypothetical protein